MNPTSATTSTASASQEAVDLFSPSAADRPDEEAHLREALKRYSPSTLEAARQLRQTGNPAYLPVFVTGVLGRFVEPDLRAKLRTPTDDLCLTEDLGVDSLTLMEIVVLAEDVLRISITNDELRRLRTLGEVNRFLAGKLDRSG